jgi:hypothetical protein
MRPELRGRSLNRLAMQKNIFLGTETKIKLDRDRRSGFLETGLS